jgi:DNA-binding LacI/PurR family transcriptional regulator
MAKNNFRIAVFSPQHQGFFYGELINQIRLLCKLKNYALDVFGTQNFGEYKSEFWFSQVNAVIIIRNAISPELARKFADAAIPCVSIAYDYFPAPIHLVSSNNRQGMQLAFDHALEQGHTRIAFVGDLSQYDLRKRYEAYCDCHSKAGLTLDETLLFTTTNTTYLGGFAAATEFISRDCDATAVICGAGLLAEGFKARVRDVSRHLYQSLSVIAFDVLPIQTLSDIPTTTVDLNLLLLAHACMTNIERQLAGHPVEHHTKVDCKLVTLPAYGDAQTHDTSPCVEATSFENPAYMKSLLSNIYEWPQSIADSGLSEVMSLAPVFGDFLQESFLTRLHNANDNTELARLMKIFKKHHTVTTDKLDPQFISPARLAPRCFKDHIHLENYELTTSFPIIINQRLWGVFTSCGQNVLGDSRHNYLGLLGYLAVSIQFLAKRLGSQEAQQHTQTPSTAQHTEATGRILWHLGQASVDWSDGALEVLGLNSPLEKNIYRHMEVDDRVHPDDEPIFRSHLQQLLEQKKPLQVQLRFKNKTGHYILCTLKAHKRPKTAEGEIVECEIIAQTGQF